MLLYVTLNSTNDHAVIQDPTWLLMEELYFTFNSIYNIP